MKNKVKDDMKTWNRRWQMFMFIVISTVVSFVISCVVYILAKTGVFVVENMLMYSIPMGLLGATSVILGFIVFGYVLKMSKKNVKGYSRSKFGKTSQEFSVMVGFKRSGMKIELGWFDAFVAFTVVPVIVTYVWALIFGNYKYFWISLVIFLVLLAINIAMGMGERRQQKEKEQRKIRQSQIQTAQVRRPRSYKRNNDEFYR